MSPRSAFGMHSSQKGKVGSKTRCQPDIAISRGKLAPIAIPWFRRLQVDRLSFTFMSSITFPNGASHGLSASNSSTVDVDYFETGFEASPTSSFQMNPLSSHPPRTPRTSVVSRSHEYGGDIYTPQEEHIEQGTESLSDDEDDKDREAAKDRIRREDIWHEMLKTSYGRDKTFVCNSNHL